MKKGFTLIETLIYIGLFTILISAGFITAFELIKSGEHLDTKTITNSELDFVLRKLDWALTGISTINTPASGYSSTLKVTKYDGTTIEFQKNSEKIEIKVNGGSFVPITTDNVKVQNLGFQVISGNPPGIIATTTINGISATTSKYIRK